MSLSTSGVWIEGLELKALILSNLAGPRPKVHFLAADGAVGNQPVRTLVGVSCMGPVDTPFL